MIGNRLGYCIVFPVCHRCLSSQCSLSIIRYFNCYRIFVTVICVSLYSGILLRYRIAVSVSAVFLSELHAGKRIHRICAYAFLIVSCRAVRERLRQTVLDTGFLRRSLIRRGQGELELTGRHIMSFQLFYYIKSIGRNVWIVVDEISVVCVCKGAVFYIYCCTESTVLVIRHSYCNFGSISGIVDSFIRSCVLTYFIYVSSRLVIADRPKSKGRCIFAFFIRCIYCHCLLIRHRNIICIKMDSTL